MNHNWDVHSNTECDTCILCSLKRKMVANVLSFSSVTNIMFREYWVNNKWMKPKDLGKVGRICPGILTDYDKIKIKI